MLNHWCLCFVLFGILYARWHGAYAHQEEGVEKRQNSSKAGDFADFDVIIDITETPKTPNWTWIPDKRTDKPTEMACTNSWGNGNRNMKYTCPSSLCQHISYGCNTRCTGKEIGNKCEINCRGLIHCLNFHDNETPLPQACATAAECPRYDGQSTCVEPCPPLCMCIVLTLNLSDTFINSASFSLINSSFFISDGDPRFQVSLFSPFIRHLVVTDTATLSDNFFRGLHRLMVLDVSGNEISSLSENLFSDLLRLKSLNMAHNRLSDIPSHLFSSLMNLKELDLSFNEIDSIHSNLFRGLSSLIELNLSNNRLVDLPHHIFHGLYKLKQLTLSHNKLEKLDEHIFGELPGLLNLYLKHNKIQIIHDDVFDGTNRISELDLFGNDLSVFPYKSLIHQVELYYLDLSKNKIEIIPDNLLKRFSYLGYLYLAGNTITVLSDDFLRNGNYLYAIDLSGNAIETLPGNLFKGLSILGYMYLNNNSISALPADIFSGLVALRYLRVSHNAIETLPDTVFRDLSSLERLYLTNNKIAVVSNYTFLGLQRLVLLKLSINAIKTLPANAFGDLSKLNELDLGNNKISDVSRNAFSGLSRLTMLTLSNNAIESLPDNVFVDLSNLLYLYLSNNKILFVSNYTFFGLNNLISLHLSMNSIKSLPANVFRGSIRLQVLLLDNNEITSLSDGTFNGLSTITYLDLFNNDITVISENAFSESSQLDFLDLSKNKIKVLHKNAFHGITKRIFLKLNNNEIVLLPSLPSNVKILDISNNAIQTLPTGTFTNRSSLGMLNIIGNNLEITEDIFKDLDNLRYLLTDVPFICCMKPKSVTEDKCLAIQSSSSDCLRSGSMCSFAKRDAISSCTDLISSNVLRVFLVIIGVSALIGNAGVIFYRLVLERDNNQNTYSLFVLNLGVSDFLMGVYLLIIGVADAYYNGVYAWNDQDWRQSIFCTTAGTLSFISSEMSTFLILLVTIDRLIVIVLPLSHLTRWRISWKQAIVVSGFFWIVSITFAIIPIVFAPSYFKGEYYSQAGVCLALPLLGDDQPGAEYSFAVFVYLNTFVFGVIVVGQIFILKTIRAKSKTVASSKTIKREKTVAKTLFLVVSTDFCCWFPIGVMGVLAKCGIKISDEAYAWVMVFVLPINAAVNPFLYTVTAIWRKRRREQRTSSMTSTTRRQLRQSDVIAKDTNET